MHIYLASGSFSFENNKQNNVKHYLFCHQDIHLSGFISKYQPSMAIYRDVESIVVTASVSL